MAGSGRQAAVRKRRAQGRRLLERLSHDAASTGCSATHRAPLGIFAAQIEDSSRWRCTEEEENALARAGWMWTREKDSKRSLGQLLSNCFAPDFFPMCVFLRVHDATGPSPAGGRTSVTTET